MLLLKPIVPIHVFLQIELLTSSKSITFLLLKIMKKAILENLPNSQF